MYVGGQEDKKGLKGASFCFDVFMAANRQQKWQNLFTWTLEIIAGAQEKFLLIWLAEICKHG